MPIIIPKKITQEGELVVISRKEYKEYEKLLKLQKKRELEIKDTNEAIRIAEKERKGGKLQVAESFRDILEAAKKYGKQQN